MEILFFFFSIVAIASALGVVLSKNPVYSVLSLICTFFAIAAQYILLNAQFLAAVHIIVYAGAIMVLFLFVIMLLNLNILVETQRFTTARLTAAFTGGLLCLVLIAALRSAGDIKAANPANAKIGLIENLGMTLFNQYLLPFEVSSLLFLAAMVGAVVLAKKEIA